MADARLAQWKETRVIAPVTRAVEGSCDWTAASFEKIRKQIAEQVPIGDRRQNALGMIERSDPTKALEGEDQMAKVWSEYERSSSTRELYEKSLAEQWRNTGCSTEGAPYVVRALLIWMDRFWNKPFFVG